jgi:GT2 family glycosyltransferase
MTKLVTIGVPVFRGQDFVAETLASLQAQTHTELEVLIYVDGADPQSEAACQPFLTDSRFHMEVLPQRVGWRNNLNLLMAASKGDYWYFNQQDDLVEPIYVETLLAHAEAHPEASIVYCDMQCFGSRQDLFTQTPTLGHPTARQLALLYEHLIPVALRGLVPASVLKQVGHIYGNEADDFGTDCLFMVGAARAGELHRIPAPLYFKRYHAENTHGKWWRWSAEDRIFGWTVHCRDMLAEAMKIWAAPEERRLLFSAAVARLLTTRFEYAQIGALPPKRRVKALRDFLALLQGARGADLAGWLDTGWDEIERSTLAFYGLR